MDQSASTPKDISLLLRQWSDGNRAALEELLPLVYDELHRQATRYLQRERVGHTLQTTAMIHEAYRDLSTSATFGGRAGPMMRRVLIDYARVAS